VQALPSLQPPQTISNTTPPYSPHKFAAADAEKKNKTSIAESHQHQALLKKKD
jgi:hypothetical protein